MTPTSQVIQHLRKAVLRQGGAGLTDGQLLGCFVERRDEAAFAALVKRHGPMVWGVCRRLLPHHDAEDAFQAAFLVLVRKAASVVPREMVANWLYGVAHRTALQARRTAARRGARERQVTPMPEPAVAEQGLWHGLRPLLDRELARLPDRYRAAIVLCDLEGKTRKEAARQVGCPEGTLAARLARGRSMLAKRLARHGPAVVGGALAAVLSQEASAGVPASVVSASVKAASLFAAGQGLAGVTSPTVPALTEGVLKAMLLSKLKAAIAVVLILGFVATGATVLTCRTAAGQDDQKPAAEKPVEPAAKQEEEKERQVFTAWGKEVGGLQAGLGFRPGEHRAYHHGETLTLVVRVRNVGKEEVKFQYLKEFFDENPPTVTDADGKKVPQLNIEAGGLIHVPKAVSLAPGKEIELASKYGGASGVRYELRPASERGKPSTGRRFTPLFGTGKVSVQYERVLGNSSAGTITLDPSLDKLATGKLELEIRSDPPPAASAFPVGWGGGGEDYEVSVDKTVRHGGKASGSIRSIATTPLWYGALTQAFKADQFRGRRLRMTAYVKSKDVENSAGLWMRIEGFDGKGNYSLSSDYMGDRPIKGSNDWKQYEVVLDVPEEGTAQVYFGVLLAGKGQVWADDFKFEAVGNAVKTTGKAGEPGKAAVGPIKGLPTEPKNLDFEK